MSTPTTARKPDDYKVQVSVRIRPSKNEHIIECVGNEIFVPPNRRFQYDRCFGPNADQNEIYELFGKDILNHALEGYNASIIAYGQTGSGKSHTMLGTQEQPGLIPQLCKSLFEYIQSVQDTTAVTVRLSFLEVYNEHVRDLLTTTQSALSLRVRSTQMGSGDCTVEGLSEYKVQGVKEVLDFLQRGGRMRSTASTKMNDQSSRSHAVVTLQIKQQTISSAATNADTKEKLSVIKLVDLAGSERAGQTSSTKERLKEGNNINKSLVTLGRVISTLAEQAASRNSNTVVPYRDSVLTRLLQNALGGNSRTAMIACVSPDIQNQDQTLSTLRYADQAKRITNKAMINLDLVTKETQGARFVNMQRELNELRQQLAAKSSVAQDSSLIKLVQFYEDEAAREKVRSRMFEMQKLEAEKQSQDVADLLREITGRGMSSIDAREGLSYEALMEQEGTLLKEIDSQRSNLSQSVSKWKEICRSYT